MRVLGRMVLMGLLSLSGMLNAADKSLPKKESLELKPNLALEREVRKFLDRFHAVRSIAKEPKQLREFFSSHFLESRGDDFLKYLLLTKSEGKFFVSSVKTYKGKFVAIACTLKKGTRKCAQTPKVYVVVPNESVKSFEIVDVYDDVN